MKVQSTFPEIKEDLNLLAEMKTGTESSMLKQMLINECLTSKKKKIPRLCSEKPSLQKPGKNSTKLQKNNHTKTQTKKSTSRMAELMTSGNIQLHKSNENTTESCRNQLFQSSGN